MIDTSLLPFAIVVLVIAALSTVLALGTIEFVVAESLAARRRRTLPAALSSPRPA